MDKIGVLLPAYNEEKNIREVIKETRRHIYNSTIVVVDDGSTDKTNELAKRSKVIVLRHKTNKGKGEAIKTGLRYFMEKKNINYIIIADTDRQYKIKEAPKLLKPLENGEADIVIGYRDWSKVPFRHRLGNFVWRSVFNLLFGTKFKDTNCGFMALRKGVIEKMKDNIKGGYIIENSMFVAALKNNLRIEQVPVPVFYKHISGVKRGVKTVGGVLSFIVKEGINYRFCRK